MGPLSRLVSCAVRRNKTSANRFDCPALFRLRICFADRYRTSVETLLSFKPAPFSWISKPVMTVFRNQLRAARFIAPKSEVHGAGASDATRGEACGFDD